MGQKGERVIGLDILRSVAMLMIVIWHLYWHGIDSGSFGCSGLSFFNYIVSEFILVCSSVCVNVFILISSYFLIDKSLNLKRIFLLWLQVVFYSFFLALLPYLFNPGSSSLSAVIKSLFPITSYTYWFITIYLGFVCIAPFLAKTAQSLQQKEYQSFLVILLLIGCTFALSFPWGNLMGAAKGYTLFWFIVVFFWGGYIRRFGIPIPPKKSLMFYFIGALIVTLFILAKACFRLRNGVTSIEIEFPAYNSLAFIISLLLFLYFKDHPFKNNFFEKTLIRLSPYTFGVYLLSENKLIRSLIWRDILPVNTLTDRIWFIPFVLFYCCAVFISCAGIDAIRSYVFKVIRMPEMCESVARYVSQKSCSLFIHESERKNP